jgi:hypothetical protein
MLSSRPALLAAIAFVLVAVSCGRGGKPSSFTLGDFCGAAKQADVNVASSEVIEASGIAASRRDDEVLWLHNDSGDTARFFAIDRTGRHVATLSLGEVEAIDWEDMAAGPGPDDDSGYLYFADIGDNAAGREEVYVYRVEEPTVSITTDTPTGGQITQFDKFTLRYPERAHDAETFMVDPDSGDFFIISKEISGEPSTVFRAPAPESAAPVTLEDVGQIDFKSLPTSFVPGPDASPLVANLGFLPTGGDISADGGLIIVRTYGTIWIWERPDDSSVAAAFDSAPVELPSEIEPQGEAIAFDANGGGYVTVSEGVNPPLRHFVAQQGAACETPRP